MTSNKHESYIVFDNDFIAEKKDNLKYVTTLPPAIYEVSYDSRFDKTTFSTLNLHMDEILELPDSLMRKTLSLMDQFWSTDLTEKYKLYGLVQKLGILLHGQPGCHAKGQGILMFDGSIKKVEDIIVGDLLMGPDSEPRKVLSLSRGKEEMAKITPTKGESFVVNKSHILHLTHSGKSPIYGAINITVDNYLKSKIPTIERYKLTRSSVNFNNNDKLEIPPYILGLWLGDGNKRSIQLTSMDDLLIKEWTDYINKLGLNIREESNGENNKSKNYFATSKGTEIRNVFKDSLVKLNLINNKHIPKEYLTSSMENRLELLAGLIDTDGSYSSSFDIIQKNEKIADGIVYLARSVGLAAYKKNTQKYCYYKNEKKVNPYFRISISGDLSIIPTRLKRKQANTRKQIKSVLRTGFKVEYLPEDNYYGFSLDKDHLYLTDDFTIHHNTGKTVIMARIAKQVVEMGGVVLFNPQVKILANTLKTIREIEPHKKIVVLWEEFDSVIYEDESALLCMLDGEVQLGNIVYLATTNYISKIPARIKNRPSRFSKVWEIKSPTKAARRSYFEQKIRTQEDRDKFVEPMTEASEGLTIDACKDLIVSVILFGESISDAVRNIKEINKEHSIGYDDFNEEQAKEIFSSKKPSDKNTLKPLR